MNDELCKLLEYIIDKSRKMGLESLYYEPMFIGNLYINSSTALQMLNEFIYKNEYLKKNFDKYYKLIAFNKNGVYKIIINSLTRESSGEFHKFLDNLENYILRDKNDEYFSN